MHGLNTAPRKFPTRQPSRSPLPAPGQPGYPAMISAGVRISSETLEDLLAALMAAGQVTVMQVNGQMVYRAVG